MRQAPNGMWRHLEKEPPEILYHYTSLSSMLSIVKSKCFYASNIFYLNDSMEYRHARKLIADRIGQRLEGLSKTRERIAMEWHQKLFTQEQLKPVYVASFSEKSDDLSQWRGYTPVGHGVCMGFDSSALREATHSIHYEAAPTARFGALGKVIYVSENEGPSFDEFIKSVCDHLDIVDGEVVRAVVGEGLANHGTPFYKHRAFKDEAEWRVSLWTQSRFDFQFEVDFRPGASTLIPFTRLHFPSSLISFLREVIVGPSPNMALSMRAAEDFLRFQGMTNVTVCGSTVPYRNW